MKYEPVKDHAERKRILSLIERCKKEQTMKYENMPKGRNKDICVRCGKRANFADRLKSGVQYDLLCLAETTSSGYMTHGNVKLCGKCMSELLMWLDRRTENSSEKPNNCETCRHYKLACDLFSEICKYEPKDEPQTCSVNGRPYTECSACEHFRCMVDEPQYRSE